MRTGRKGVIRDKTPTDEHTLIGVNLSELIHNYASGSCKLNYGGHRTIDVFGCGAGEVFGITSPKAALQIMLMSAI